MSADGYRVGIVGCGTTGVAHARAYQTVPGATVVAAADQHEPTLSSFATEFDLEAAFESERELLASVDVDIISICTWHSSHAPIAVAACEAGVSGLFVEKPIATSWGETLDMLDAAERHDVTITVGHQTRYAPVHEELRSLVTEGAIGKPHAVHVRHEDGLLNMGTHLVDITRYVLGDPEPSWVIGSIERRTDRYERGIPIEDRAQAQVAFGDGTRLTIESDLPGPEAAESALQVYGSRGVVELDRSTAATITTIDGTRTLAPEADRPLRVRYVEDLLAAVRGDLEDHRCDGREAARTMEVLMGIYESARRREVVEFPLETRANALELMLEAGELSPDRPGRYDIRLPFQSVRDDRAT